VLKPSKCFLVVTSIALTPQVKDAIALWLQHEIPDWKDMQIVNRGKYLGVFLGVGGCEKTFEVCEEKYLSRCFDLSQSVASGLPTIVRYNERAVPVFSYVSQVLIHPDIPRLKRLEQRGIHKVLKLPPNCMNQKLLHSFGHFCPVSPKPLFSLCIAANSRFAKAEENAIRLIQSDALQLLGNNLSLFSHGTSTFPSGNIVEKPFIQNLIDSLERKGVYSQFSNQLQVALTSRGRSPHWSQAWFVNVFSRFECATDMQYELTAKILKTFDADISYHLTFPGDWYNTLAPILRDCKPFVGMCLFKTYIGGWTTSSRMHERVIHGCLFGCSEATDNINHYMQCSPLWQIACQSLDHRDPFVFSERLCLMSPNPGNAQLLALVFLLYHSAHGQARASPVDDVIPSPRVAQLNAVQAARALRLHVV